MLLLKGRQQLQDAFLEDSFFELAHTTFGIDLAQWAELGYWDDHYIPYVFMFNNEVIANVSVSIATMILDSKPRKAAQIGTVMTRTGYEKKGLIRRLLQAVLDDFTHVEILYLFANEGAVGLYPKFGFEKRSQVKYSLQVADLYLRPAEVKKLDMQDAKARELLFETVIHRMPVSLKLGILQNEAIVMFHALTTYKDCMYYVPSLQIIVIAKEEGETMHIVDIIAKRPMNVLEVLEQLPITGNTVELGFTPDELAVTGKQTSLIEKNTLFVKLQSDEDYSEHRRFPLTAKA
ncbi:MAG: GNAT family N-acetyltransferase [Solibacillus sp.]